MNGISQKFITEPQFAALAAEADEADDAAALHESWRAAWAGLQPAEVVVQDDYAESMGLIPQYKKDAVQQAAAVLGDAGLDLFRADGRLVRLAHLEAVDEHGVHVPAGAVAVLGVSRDSIAHLAWTHVGCVRLSPDKRRRRILKRRVKCPPELAGALAEIDAWGCLPELLGISTCPQIDLITGAAHLNSGYDPGSRLFYDLGGTVYVDGPERPDEGDVEAAAAVLRDLTREFYVAAVDEALPPPTSPEYAVAEARSREVSRAAIVALILTAAIHWRCLHPLWGGTAYNPGSGKSTVGSMMACIINGEDSPITYAWPANKDENEKQLTTIALQKHPFVVFDNAEGRINAPKLNILVSEGKLNARLFGKIDEEIQAKCRTLFYINGNGLRISADLIRRTILFCLNAPEERSSDTVYSRDIEAFTLEHRVEIWTAIITILRYSIQHGADLARQFPLRPLAGFDVWSRIVRRACLAGGWADPAASQDVLYAADPERQELETVVTAWLNAYGETDVCVAEVLRAAGQGAGYDRSVQAAAAALLEAWEDAIPRRGEISARIIGAWLQRRQRRPVSGWMIAHVGKGPQGAFWRLVRHGRPSPASAPEPDAGAGSGIVWQPWDSARDSDSPC